MMKSGSGLAAKSIERVLELSPDAQIKRRESGRVFWQVAKGVLRVPRRQNAPSNLS